jgi:hypothetical protein
MDPALRTRMGAAARRFVEANRVDEPFTAILDSEAYRRRLQEQKDKKGVSRLDEALVEGEAFQLPDAWPEADEIRAAAG